MISFYQIRIDHLTFLSMPVNKLALSWLAGYIRLFSRGHWVRGITPSNVIEKTISAMEPKLQQILDERTDQYWDEISEESWS